MSAVGPRAVRLLIVRHGPAEEEDPARWPDDSKRPLDKGGRAELKRALEGVGRFAGKIDLLASSPALRARETAELLAQAADGPSRLETWPELEPGAPAAPILHRVAAEARGGQQVAVVGHAPTLPNLIGFALSGEEVVLAHLARGGAAALEFPVGVRAGAGTLLWLLTRKQLSDVRP